VKARVFQYLPLCVFLLAACGPTASRSPADAITFDTLRGLDDFEFATAGDGKPGEWSIIENDAGRVLAQIIPILLTIAFRLLSTGRSPDAMFTFRSAS
jgi:hypothetical protein